MTPTQIEGVKRSFAMEDETRTDTETTNPRTIDIRIVPRLPVPSEDDGKTDGVYSLNEDTATTEGYVVSVVSVPILLEI